MEIVDFFLRGGVSMTIWDNVSYDANRRPKYTKYEIAKRVRDKRKAMNLSIGELASRYDVEESIIKNIEEAKKNFSTKIYNACSKILDMEVMELVQFDEENLDLCVSYRIGNDEISKEIESTVCKANNLFNEMIMQHKTNV